MQGSIKHALEKGIGRETVPIQHQLISLIPKRSKIQLPGSKLLDFEKLLEIPQPNIDKYR